MTVGELETVIDSLAPFALAEDWDNVGLMVGRRERLVERVLVALELRAALLDEAVASGCEAIVVHHPPIFPSLSALTDSAGSGELVLRAAEERIAIVAAHTNLDSASGGLNDFMAEELGIQNSDPLSPNAQNPAVGLGRVGPRASVALGDLVEQVRSIYGADVVIHSGDPDTAISRVACCTGSGAGMIDLARESGASVYVTCDLKYHDADRAGDLPLVGLGHATVERHAMRRWTETLAEHLKKKGAEAIFATTDTDPWSPSR